MGWPEELAAIAAGRRAPIPYDGHMGFRLVSWSPDGAVVEADVDGRFTNPTGVLHVVSASQRPDAGRPGGPVVPRDDLAATFRKGWSLLGVRDLWHGAGGAGDQHAWLASFARVPERRRERSVVRNFTDLGAFGSLDLGAATDRPPWGS